MANTFTGTEATGATAYAVVADVTGDGAEFTLPSGWVDADVTAAIAVAQERVDALTRDHWVATTLALILSGDGGDLLELRQVTHWPCISITQIEYREDYDSSDTFTDDGEVVPADDYALSKSRRAIIRSPETSNVWVSGLNNYKVTGTFGRATTPRNIKRATVLLTREHMSPGYLVEFEVPYSEWFPDGYRYIGQLPNKTQQNSYTGYPVVDALLEPFIRKTPSMLVP